MFSNFVNFVRIDLKIGTHINWTYTMYLIKNALIKNNAIYVSMTTKYPILKHRAFFKTFTYFISVVIGMYSWYNLRPDGPYWACAK